MSVTYFGRVAVKGIPGTIAFTGTGSVAIGDDDMVSRSVGVTDEMDMVELPNKTGAVVGAATENRRKRITLEWVPTAPSGGTQSETNAKTSNIFPGFSAATAATYQVTLASFGGDIDGVYNYFGGATMGLTSEGFVSYTMPLVQYGGAAFTAAT